MRELECNALTGEVRCIGLECCGDDIGLRFLNCPVAIYSCYSVRRHLLSSRLLNPIRRPADAVKKEHNVSTAHEYSTTLKPAVSNASQPASVKQNRGKDWPNRQRVAFANDRDGQLKDRHYRCKVRSGVVLIRQVGFELPPPIEIGLGGVGWVQRYMQTMGNMHKLSMIQ